MSAVRCCSDAAEAAERALRGNVDKHDEEDVDESCCVDGNPFKRLDKTQLVDQRVSSSVRYTTHRVPTNLENLENLELWVSKSDSDCDP